jgi:hypothetical protein
MQTCLIIKLVKKKILSKTSPASTHSGDTGGKRGHQTLATPPLTPPPPLSGKARRVAARGRHRSSRGLVWISARLVSLERRRYAPRRRPRKWCDHGSTSSGLRSDVTMALWAGRWMPGRRPRMVVMRRGCVLESDATMALRGWAIVWHHKCGEPVCQEGGWFATRWFSFLYIFC